MRPTYFATFFSIASILAVFPSFSHAQGAPDTLSFQGFLTDTAGVPITDPSVSMTVKLYEDGVPTWEEIHPSVEVTDGFFNILLGVTTPLDTLAFDAPYELGITVDGDPEISPRTTLAAAAYAKALPGMYTFYRDDGTNQGVNVVGGAPNNMVAGGTVGATIGGGGGVSNAFPLPNSVQNDFATVGGGLGNTATGVHGTVGGGVQNTAAEKAFVGGGSGNSASGVYSTVSGGNQNSATGRRATVPGGQGNEATGGYSFAAGRGAKANHGGAWVWADSSANTDFISTDIDQFLIRAAGGVGIGTNAPGSQLTVNGMIESTSLGFKFPDGSVQTEAAGVGAFWSLTGNAGTNPGTDFIGTTDSTALQIRVNSLPRLTLVPLQSDGLRATNVVMGYPNNSVLGNAIGATISGGGGWYFDHQQLNRVGGDWGTVSGGHGNYASGDVSTVGGGEDNMASGEASIVSGGRSNSASNWSSSVGGGDSNDASGRYASISGGYNSDATGTGATVPGGMLNTAEGNKSFAAGWRAKALHTSTFVWADSIGFTGTDFESTAHNQFLIRASGGVGIGTNAPLGPLDIQESDWQLTSASLESDDLLIESTDALVGLYSPNIGTWGSGLILAEVDNTTGGLHNKWAIVREAGLADGHLHFKFGVSSNYASNQTVFSIGTNALVTSRASIQPWTDDLYDLGTPGQRWQDIHLVNNPSVTSDARLKTDVRNLSYGLQDILELHPVTFKWIKNLDATANLGLIAQEVERVIPEVVEHPKESDGPLSLQYSELIPVLIRAIQDQQQIIERQGAALVDQGERIAMLERRLRP